jgi:hypothetical protein
MINEIFQDFNGDSDDLYDQSLGLAVIINLDQIKHNNNFYDDEDILELDPLC